MNTGQVNFNVNFTLLYYEAKFSFTKYSCNIPVIKLPQIRQTTGDKYSLFIHKKCIFLRVCPTWFGPVKNTTRHGQDTIMQQYPVERILTEKQFVRCMLPKVVTLYGCRISLVFYFVFYRLMGTSGVNFNLENVLITDK